MLVVAIGAPDQALVYTMMFWHIELGFLLQVTGIAKLGLFLDQQVFFRFRVVRRVAVNAAYLVLPVERIRAIELTVRGSMAAEASGIHLGLGGLLKFEELGCIARVGDMTGGPAVATLAPLLRRATARIKRRPKMGAFFPTVVIRLVAGFAGFGTNVLRIRRSRRGSLGRLISPAGRIACSARSRPSGYQRESTCKEKQPPGDANIQASHGLLSKPSRIHGSSTRQLFRMDSDPEYPWPTPIAVPCLLRGIVHRLAKNCCDGRHSFFVILITQ